MSNSLVWRVRGCNEEEPDLWPLLCSGSGVLEAEVLILIFSHTVSHSYSPQVDSGRLGHLSRK